MTTLFDKIKADQLTARKAHDALAASLLTTLIGEATAIGKNDGNREVTDADILALCKKFIKGMDEMIGYLGASNPEGTATANAEKTILLAYMPQQMTETELTTAITAIVATVGKNFGAIMNALKTDHAGLYDAKLAATIIKALS